ncbi:MAG: hypothetical protein ACRDRE_01915 [Pseudonocardiaceae bacterium]
MAKRTGRYHFDLAQDSGAATTRRSGTLTSLTRPPRCGCATTRLSGELTQRAHRQLREIGSLAGPLRPRRGPFTMSEVTVAS